MGVLGNGAGALPERLVLCHWCCVAHCVGWLPSTESEMGSRHLCGSVRALLQCSAANSHLLSVHLDHANPNSSLLSHIVAHPPQPLRVLAGPKFVFSAAGRDCAWPCGAALAGHRAIPGPEGMGKRAGIPTEEPPTPEPRLWGREPAGPRRQHPVSQARRGAAGWWRGSPGPEPHRQAAGTVPAPLPWKPAGPAFLPAGCPGPGSACTARPRGRRGLRGSAWGAPPGRGQGRAAPAAPHRRLGAAAAGPGLGGRGGRRGWGQRAAFVGRGSGARVRAGWDARTRAGTRTHTRARTRTRTGSRPPAEPADPGGDGASPGAGMLPPPPSPLGGSAARAPAAVAALMPSGCPRRSPQPRTAPRAAA